MSIETAIDTTEIERTSALVSTASGLRKALKRTRSAKDLHRAFVLGTIPVETVRDYAQGLTAGFQRGVRFPYEPELCLLAVALEENESDVAEEFLRDLAQVRVAEMPMSPRVAALCLNARKSYPKNKLKVYRASSTPSIQFELLQPLPEHLVPIVTVHQFAQGAFHVSQA